jgi:hypothetical protein
VTGSSRSRQPDLEARYWELLAAEVGTVEACRAAGITRKTGYRWRAERGGLAPVELAETARSNRYLSVAERRRIATLRGQKLGVREIAAASAGTPGGCPLGPCPWLGQVGPCERVSGGADGVDRVGLGARPTSRTRRTVELDHELIALGAVGGEAGAVASGSLHRPGPQRPVLCGELDQCQVARWVGAHCLLGEDGAGGCRDDRRCGCVCGCRRR